MGRPRIVKRVALKLDLGQGKLGDHGVSDYSSTYIRHRNFQPTKSMRPDPLPPITQYPPMELETTNMKTFVKKDLGAKRGLIKPVENHLEGGRPFNSTTVYGEEFQRKSPEPISQKRPKTHADAERGLRAKFDDRTVNKASFKDWNYRMPQRYGEIPTYTHSLLFPDKDDPAMKDSFLSRTQLDYPHKTIQKPSMVKAAEPNIKVGEGDQCHETTHRSNFKYIANESRERNRPASKEPAVLHSLPKMDVTTKYQADFPFKRKYPPPPKAAVPAPDTLEIKMNNRHSFDTEQRHKYHGWDVNKHRRPDPAKLSDNTQPSDEPMVTETTTSHDFCKKKAERMKVAVAAPEVHVKMGRFRDLTTNRQFYQDWGARRRMRHGDFHEACKELYNKKEQAKSAVPLKTTTKSTFVAKEGRPRTSMKPDFQTIDTSLEQDFRTVTKMVYKYPPSSAYELEDFEVKC